MPATGRQREVWMSGSAPHPLATSAWSLLLALVILGPALGPGYVLSYDMVWVPDLALRPDFLGLGSGLPRAVPSDAVVAVLDEVIPGMLLQKLVLLLALTGGGVGVARLLPGRPLVAQLLAVTLYDWNALVVERLLIGHWPVLLGYAVLPWVLGAGRDWRLQGRLPLRLLWLVPAGSLSASAGLATAVVLLAFAAGRCRWLGPALLVVAANAPWLVSGLLHSSIATTDAAGAEAFALQNEGSVPAPLAALSLGGIWNSEVVPDSRSGVLGWVSVAIVLALVGIGVRSWLRRTERRDRVGYLACWLAGFGLALLSWAAPGALGWLVAHVPGAGVARDGSRLLVLCAPLLVVLVAEGAAVLWARRPPGRTAGLALGVGLVLAPVAVLPDAAWGIAGRLRPAEYPVGYGAAREIVAESVPEPGDVLLLPFTSYRQPPWNHDRKVLDPLGRYLTRDYVASDVLVVSGVRVAGEDPRVHAVAKALAEPSPAARGERLGRLGIAAVVVDQQAPGDHPEVAGAVLLEDPEVSVVAIREVSPREVPTTWTAAMALAWTVFLGLLGTAVVTRVARTLRGRRREVSR